MDLYNGSNGLLEQWNPIGSFQKEVESSLLQAKESVKIKKDKAGSKEFENFECSDSIERFSICVPTELVLDNFHCRC